ncbi:MAG: PDZ domain-containing protein, partial [Myxococcales bacterium]|nr:PDZ domain-containing protein [Myxococcales bacterium]
MQQEDPFAVPEPEDCTAVANQNQFVVDVMSDFYLWNADVPTDIDINAYADPADLVKELRNENDRWTRISDIATSDALFMEGKYIGIGYKTVRMEDNSVRISFVSDNSPASAAGILRGDLIVGVGGYTVEQLDADGLWGTAYGEDEPGVEVEIEIEHYATGETELLTVTKDWIDVVSLPVVETFDTVAGPVGYFVMDKFVETTKDELENTYEMFKDAGVGPVVIDLRYNGGGLISVAERVVDLAVGADHDGGVAFSFEYNQDLSAENYSAYVSKLDNS